MHDQDPRGYHGKPWTDSFGRARRPWASHEDRIGGLRVTRYGAAAIAAMNRDWEAGRMPGFQRDTGRGSETPADFRARTRAPRVATRTHVGAGRTARQRPRARRAAASSTTSSADPGDDGSEPPPPRLTLWRHPYYGLCSPAMLRLLHRAQAEAQR